jgi:hypothetical protein
MIFVGKWRKGPTGLEATIFNEAKTPSGGEVNIASNSTIRDFFSFLSREYSKELEQWLSGQGYVRRKTSVTTVHWSDETWKVPSNTRKGVEYEVTRQGDRLSCGCQGFGYRGTCSHVDQIRKQEGL